MTEFLWQDIVDPTWVKLWSVQNDQGTSLGRFGVICVLPPVYALIASTPESTPRGRVALNILRVGVQMVFASFPVRWVWACTGLRHVGRLLCAAGFERVGVLPESEYVNGRVVDNVFYRIPRERVV